MKFGIVVFPGSNCDHDAYHVVRKVLGQPAVFLWHKDRDLQDVDVVILPGGFAFGDYLRCGAIARFSPVMEEVVRFAGKGGKVLGICNGFQVLTEAGLLPGALLQNASCKFVCRQVELMVENDQTPFSKALQGGQRIRMPVAHGDGNYFIDDDGLRRLEGEGRIVFRYIDNPNGSRANIAGVINDGGNVLGLASSSARAKTRGWWTSAKGWRSPSRWRATTTRATSSRTRAPPPAWAESSGTSSLWERARSHCSTPCDSAKGRTPRRATSSKGWWRESPATAIASAFPPSVGRSPSTPATKETAWSTSSPPRGCPQTRSSS